MKDVHAAARDTYRLWKHSGKPRQGGLYDLMKQTRSKFKYALTVCKGNKTLQFQIQLHRLCVQRMTGLFGET